MNYTIKRGYHSSLESSSVEECENEQEARNCLANKLRAYRGQFEVSKLSSLRYELIDDTGFDGGIIYAVKEKPKICFYCGCEYYASETENCGCQTEEQE